jgi:hypothetical protein
LTLPPDFVAGQPLELESNGDGTYKLTPVITVALTKFVNDLVEIFKKLYIPDGSPRTSCVKAYGVAEILENKFEVYPPSVIREAGKCLENIAHKWCPREPGSEDRCFQRFVERG